MIRRLEFETELFTTDIEVIAEIEQARVASWALEMALLLGGHAEGLVVPGTAGVSIVISLLTDRRANLTRTTVTRESPGRLRFELPRNQAEYMAASLLRAYRDGMAEVNHIHIEGTANGGPVDLTICFKSYQPPMSSEDAARLVQD